MKANCFKLIHLLAIAMLGLFLSACGNAIFSTSDGNNAIKANEDFLVDEEEGDDSQPLDDLVFIDDSFERDEIPFDIENQILYGWRGFIDDHGVDVFGFTGNDLGMKIFDDTQMGPAFDGNRALYFYGREGSSVHTFYLISQPYDLSDYNTVILSFRYLTFALNDATDEVPEYLELQVCNNPDLNQCGANADNLNGPALRSAANWTTVYSIVPGAEDDNLNGKNHSVTDWRTAVAPIDLNDESIVGSKSEFVFRIVARMRDGFEPGNQGGNGGNGGNGGQNDKCDRDCDKECKNHHNKSKCKQDCKSQKEKCNKGKCDKHDHKNCKHKNCGHSGKHEKCGIICWILKIFKGLDCDHKKHDGKYNDDCKCKCDNGDDQNNDDDDNDDNNNGGNTGALKDGIAIDKIMGIATQRDIGDIF